MKTNRKTNKKTTNKKTETVNNTIFDDVFRTIAERMPTLMIPLINEVFHTDYGEDEEIIPVHNEHLTKSGEIITDSCLLIRSRLYHIECQSKPDSTMAVRMIEYDFAIALEHTELKDGIYEMEFPKSCTLYLRSTENTPDELKVRIHFDSRMTEDGRDSIVYTTPVIKVQAYTMDEIFQKKLLLFLPFYIMRYEKSFKKMQTDEKLLNRFLSEYEDIRAELEKECTEEKKSELYTDLMELIIRISDYMLKSEKDLQERIGAIMGGKVLKLRSEILRETREEGREEGRIAGREEGRIAGREEGRIAGREEGRIAEREEGQQKTLQAIFLYKNGESVENIVTQLGLSKDFVTRLVSEI
jgi:hypothetical protein